MKAGATVAVIEPRLGPDGVTVARRIERAGSPAPCKCPFHGMVGSRHGILNGGPVPGGNACGLAFAHAPCRLQIRGERPDWDACDVYNVSGPDRVADRVISTYVAFPPGREEAVPMADWYERVMGRPHRVAGRA